MKVIINAAMTVDGKIATVAGDSGISSREDLKRVHKLRSDSDAVVVGITTVLADDPLLTVRLVKGKNPARVVIDSSGRIPSESQILRTADRIRTIVAVAKKASEENIRRVREAGAQVLVAGKDTVDLEAIFDSLRKMGFKKVLVEGGGELNWSVLNLGLADELIVTIAPKIVGGRLAPTVVEGFGFDRISKGIKLKLLRVQRKKTGEVILFFKT